MRLIRIFRVFALALIVSMSAEGEVYRWVDEAGNVHFGDHPPNIDQVQEITPKTHQPDLLDPGELRRQRLLNKANKDAAERLRRRHEEDQSEKMAEVNKRLIDSRCMEMRRQLDILQYQMPAYLDEQDKYRVKWLEDAYTGQRQYIDDATRAAEIKSLEERIEAKCKHQDPESSQRAAHRQNYMIEKCTAAQVAFEAIVNPKKRSTRDDIEKAQRKVRFYCGQSPP